MEAQQHQQCNRDALPTKFITKFLEIPVIKFGVEHATGVYGRVKDFNTITHKSFELAENVTGAFVGRVTPFAQRGICLAAQPLALHKFDTLAANSLQSLEDKVPVMKQEPQVLMSDMTGAVTDKLKQTKDRVTKASEGVLISRPVQTYFDLLAFFLNTASKTLDKVLPPCADEEDKRATHTTGEEEKRSERGWNLLAQFFELLGTAKNRVVGKVRHRIEKTSNAVYQRTIRLTDETPAPSNRTGSIGKEKEIILIELAFNQRSAECHARLAKDANKEELAGRYAKDAKQCEQTLDQVKDAFGRNSIGGMEAELRDLVTAIVNPIETLFEKDLKQCPFCLTGNGSALNIYISHPDEIDDVPKKFIRKIAGKLLEIPVIKFGVEIATGVYGIVKSFNTVTHISFKVAEYVTGAFAGCVTPFVQRGICLVAQPITVHRFDTLAANYVQSWEHKVPVMKQEPPVKHALPVAADKDLKPDHTNGDNKHSPRMLRSGTRR